MNFLVICKEEYRTSLVPFFPMFLAAESTYFGLFFSSVDETGAAISRKQLTQKFQIEFQRHIPFLEHHYSR